MSAHDDGDSASASASASDSDWDVYWKNGTRFESPDGEFELKIGGRAQLDFTSASGDDGIEDGLGEPAGGSELRRARLYLQGTLHGRFEFKAQYDFAGGAMRPNDVYVGVRDLPAVGGFRVGHFKEPLSLEQLTSSKNIPFLERGMADSAANEGRNMGLMLHNAILDGRLNWWAGAFQPSDGLGTFEGDEIHLTGRVSGLLHWKEDGRRLFHLGLGITDRDVDGTDRIRIRPEVHLSPRLIDTGDFAADAADAWLVDAAVVEGPFWASASFAEIDSGASPGSSHSFDGYSVQAGFYLTGEHRRYKKGGGAWDRQQPKRPFLRERGPGAWEIALRLSTLDANDGTVTGGDLENFAVALNWYPNSAFRWMLNWIRSDLEGVGEADFITTRFQVEF